MKFTLDNVVVITLSAVILAFVALCAQYAIEQRNSQVTIATECETLGGVLVLIKGRVRYHSVCFDKAAIFIIEGPHR